MAMGSVEEPAPAWLGSALQQARNAQKGEKQRGPREHPRGIMLDPGTTQGKRGQGRAHLSPAPPAPLASVIYGIIWAASNLIKGHCKLVNRFK